MKVQRVQIPGQDRVTWLVIGDDYLPIRPIQEYLAYLENIERSPHTIRAYAHHLCLYWHYLQETKLDWITVGLGELAEFVAWLRRPLSSIVSLQEQEAKRSEVTINAILAAVCMLYDFHERLGTTPEHNFYRDQVQPYRTYKHFLYHLTKGKPVRTRLIKLKAPRRLPNMLTAQQFEQMLAVCHRLRDKFLVSLLYESGIRVGQLLGLRHGDIRSWDNLIRIVPRNSNPNGARAKTRESYTISVPPSLMALYTSYLVEEFGETDSDFVFVNLWGGKIGQPMTYAAVIDLFRRMSKASGVQVHPHLLRHTHATLLLQSGMDAAYVQKRLGHASVQTTINTYVHLTDEDLKRAYQTYSRTRKQQASQEDQA
jgi:integrase/recombinase XerD